ncbi:MAG: hypothetical protein AABW84_00305 [Nanoarchaeota archaeon]
MAMPKITPEYVTDIVRRFGPLLPIELAKKISMDSFIAKAFLSQMLEANQIKITNERVGNEFLYYVSGQEAAARARLQSFGLNKQSEVRVAPTKQNVSVGKVEVKVSTYGTPPPITPVQSEYDLAAPRIKDTKELQKKQEQFLQRLREIEEREVKQKKLKAVLPITVEDIKSLFVEKPVAVGGEILSKLKNMNIESDVVEEVKELIEEQIGMMPQELDEVDESKLKSKLSKTKTKVKEIIKPKTESKVKKLNYVLSTEQEEPIKSTQLKMYDEGNCVIQAVGYLTGIGGVIISKELQKKGKDAEIIVELESAIGPLKMLAIVRDKKIINDADLNMAYNTGLDKKIPVLFLTKGKLTKKAEEYHKSIHSLTVKHIGE